MAASGKCFVISRLRRNELPQPAPSLLSLPEGEMIKEGSLFLCRVLNASKSSAPSMLVFQHPVRGSGRIRPAALIGQFAIIIVLTALAVGACLTPAMAQQSGDDAWVATEKGVPTAPVIIDGHLLF